MRGEKEQALTAAGGTRNPEETEALMAHRSSPWLLEASNEPAGMNPVSSFRALGSAV